MGSSRGISGKSRVSSRRTAPVSVRLDQIPSGAVLLDGSGRIVNANAAAARIFRRKRRELRGRALSEWIPSWEAAQSKAETATRGRIEVDGQRADGSRTTFRLARREVNVGNAPSIVVFIADCERRKKLESEVRDAGYGFHQIARVMPHMLWTCSPDGAATYISPQWIKLTGEPLDTHLGYGWLDHLHPADRPEIMRRWQFAIERKETFKAEFRVCKADGSYRWFDSTCLVVRDRGGAMVRWMGSHVDIHESHEMRLALTGERDRLAKIAETVPGAIYAYRMLPDGSTALVFASAGIEDLFGLPAQEVARRDADGMGTVHPEDRNRVRESVFQSAQHLTLWRCEWRVLNPQKGELWVQGRAVPTREADGSTLWYGILVDITDQKRAEEELRRSQARLKAAVMASGIGTWICDIGTNKLWFDETLLAMVDNVDEEIEYGGLESLARLVHPEDWPHVAPAIQAMREGKTDTYNVEYRNPRRDQALQWLAVNARAERDATGKIIRVTGACTDITARKAAEETQRQSQRLEALGTLAGGIAHDFNNILLAITGNARLALAELPLAAAPDLPLRRNLLEIDRASARATDLVHRILAFSRQSEPRRDIIQLRSPVEEAVKLLRATLPAMIEIEISCAQDTPAVLADSTQICQIVMNLVTNSAYALGDNPGRVSVSLDKQTVTTNGALCEDLKPGLYARICVTDTGAGMDRETLGRIFDPFFTTKPPGQGTGLGLSVVHGIMRSHQGAITVSSEPGRGCVFRLYFPAAAQPERLQPKAQPGASRGEGQRILYIDDEDSLVYLITRVLERLGYEVTGFTDAQKALQAFRENPAAFDVVVTDLSMPGMSGFHLARLLSQTRPDIPVLMTSGYIRTQDRQIAQQLGIRELILKPNTIEELGHALARLFEAQRACRS